MEGRSNFDFPETLRFQFKAPVVHGCQFLTYLEAIRQGIWEEMERDPSVFLLGEDIGVLGGAFKVTAGMLEKFGDRARGRHAHFASRRLWARPSGRR